jgi:hypothetical protein
LFSRLHLLGIQVAPAMMQEGLLVCSCSSSFTTQQCRSQTARADEVMLPVHIELLQRKLIGRAFAQTIWSSFRLSGGFGKKHVIPQDGAEFE